MRDSWPHFAISGDVLRQSNPHERLRPDAALGISVQPEEIHAHLGQLSENGLVVVTVPPVGAFGKIVERLDAPPIEQRPSRFVQRRPFQRNLSIWYDVAVQIKPDSQVFGQTIRTIERTELIATNDCQHGPIFQLNGL